MNQENSARAILDCTLRDGGYINDWSFSGKQSCAIIQSLVDAGVDIIECGFVSQTKGRSESTQFPSLAAVDQVLGNLPLDETDAPLFVAMINYGEFDLDSLPTCGTAPNQVQGIRIAFHKKQWRDFQTEAHKIVEKGYKLFIQPMLTVGYSDREILDLLDAFHPINYYAMYIVDTFGSMSGEQFRRYHALFENNLKPEARLGYHSHNNLQLAYSNAITFLDLAHTREIIIDSSILGMGRGAGNLNTELLAGYMNERIGSQYAIEPLLEVIDSYLEDIKRDHHWGYSIAHFLSASINCHPNYSSFLLDRKNLTVREIKELLERIPLDQRVRYNGELIQELYQNSIRQIHSAEHLPDDLFKGTPVIALASGPSALRESENIKKHRASRNACIVALNHLPVHIAPDYVFISNQKRYDEFADRLNPQRLILTTNLDVKPAHNNCITVDYQRLLLASPAGSDNVACLFLSLISSLGLDELSIAGLDGYSLDTRANYSYEEHGAPRELEVLKTRNRELADAIHSASESMKLHFLTSSQFERQLPLSVCGVIPARYQSSRFEGKPLARIAGIPMLQRTYDRVKECPGLNHLTVATDDSRIENFCREAGIPCIMTSGDCLTGTDRVAEVAAKTDHDFYVNIQGDEPVIEPSSINQVLDSYREHKDRYMAYNLYKPIDPEEDPVSSSMIKVIVNENDELLYMSRCAVPFAKGERCKPYAKQVCVYGFTRQALDLFASRGKGPVEQAEDIEILRFIEMGHKVRMIMTDSESIAVDNPEDIARVEAWLESNG